MKPVLLAVVFAGAFAFMSPAQAQDAHDRPRVALVLSGGGALGLAHVGAIQELERLGIHPDIVVGTSMGAVVGGLYASGVDATTLGRVVQEVDWTGVFNPAPDRDDLTFRQKAQQADFPVRLSLGLRDGAFVLPAGLISDQVLMQELRRFTPIQGVVEDFDTLPIPYRAVATDIATGEAVVLSSGEVPMAMRASMAVPGVFAPVESGGRLMVDGGMAANIPISVARDMGADVIIVVATPSALLAKDEISSALDILGQSVSLLVLANERAQLATLTSRDILITIDAGDMTSADFTRGAELIEAGRRSVDARAVALAALAQDRSLVSPVQPSPSQPPIIEYVRIENGSRLADAVIERMLTGLIGQPVDHRTINAALDDIYALGPFERVDHALEVVDGRTGLLVHGEDSVPEDGRIRLGLTIWNDFSTGSEDTLFVDYRTGELDGFGSELQLQAALGSHNGVSAAYFKLLEPSQTWFANARVAIENRPVERYSPTGFNFGSYDLTYGLATIEAGGQFGGNAEVRVGFERGQGRAELDRGRADPTEIDIDVGRLTASAGVDTLDSPYFPRRGVRLGARFVQGLESLGDNTEYQTVTARALTAISSGRHTLITAASGGSSLEGSVPVDSLYWLGGLFSLSGYRQDELVGQTFAAGGLIYRYALTDTSRQLFGGTRLFVGASLEAGQVWDRRGDLDLEDLRFGGSVYVGADTILGPAFLAYGQAEDDRRAVYLFIGRPF
ncbi:patatin-like phospholipase family protein [Brevundimonas subvibrioides]|uniref:patatin-like phospholipase family protein n=1 Tax=Brevundimonas subvibrioides TaxID=74313 RepID=UPI0022B522BA|nr:patatin-like phospholipase family protein [Brevundimonas subvibrioides]